MVNVEELNAQGNDIITKKKGQRKMKVSSIEWDTSEYGEGLTSTGKKWAKLQIIFKDIEEGFEIGFKAKLPFDGYEGFGDKDKLKPEGNLWKAFLKSSDINTSMVLTPDDYLYRVKDKEYNIVVGYDFGFDQSKKTRLGYYEKKDGEYSKKIYLTKKIVHITKTNEPWKDYELYEKSIEEVIEKENGTEEPWNVKREDVLLLMNQYSS